MTDVNGVYFSQHSVAAGTYAYEKTLFLILFN